MSLQYTYDAKGNPTCVFIPINQWDKITSDLKNKKITRKNKILKSIERGMKQVNQIEKGKLKSISLKKLLDTL
ncbi:MAG TPA: hypothetical protein VI548_05155 [Chitinophagaceae bacterium]|nr:hypothetical protein [Chitinophagaceae bacterium]